MSIQIIMIYHMNRRQTSFSVKYNQQLIFVILSAIAPSCLPAAVRVH